MSDRFRASSSIAFSRIEPAQSAGVPSFPRQVAITYQYRSPHQVRFLPTSPVEGRTRSPSFPRRTRHTTPPNWVQKRDDLPSRHHVGSPTAASVTRTASRRNPLRHIRGQRECNRLRGSCHLPPPLPSLTEPLRPIHTHVNVSTLYVGTQGQPASGIRGHVKCPPSPAPCHSESLEESRRYTPNPPPHLLP